MTQDWKTISRQMKKEAAVFVGGVPRSGTTVLRATLDRHPSFRAREDLSAETRVFVEPDSLREVKTEKGERFRTYLLDDEGCVAELAEVLDTIGPPGRFRRLLGKAFESLSESEFRRSLNWRLTRRADLVRVFFYFARRARGCRRLLEKTPRHMNFLPEIRATFPNMKAVWCVRHPVDVYASYRKKLARAEERVGVQPRHDWLRISPERFCKLFEKWANRLLTHRRREKRQCRVVRYEDLTADPAGTLREVCAFLDEPFDRVTLIEGGQDDARLPRPGSRIVVNPKKWQRHLSEEDATLLEERLAPVMEPFHFQRYT